MKRYSEYKDSGVEWIGEIPSHWKLTKLKREFEFSVGGTPASGNMEYYTTNEDEGYKWVNISDLNNRVISDTKSYVTSEGIKNTSMDLVTEGSMLFSFKLSVGQVAFIDKPMYTNEAIASFSPKNNSNNLKYLYYASPIYIVENANENIYGAKILNQELIKNAFIVLPPIEEQEKIANFLDKKTSQIENLISKKEELIETLKASRTKLISETVTKGLDKDVPMKDSGVEWIGEIPSHWEVKKLKFVMNNFNSKRKPIDADKRSREGDILYDYYGASGVIDKIDDYIFDETSLLIAEDGANLVMRNLPLIYIAKGKYWVNNHAHILRPKEGNSLGYMAYQMENIDYTEYITGSAQPKLSQENLNKVLLVTPPFSEQESLCIFLDERTSQIDTLVATIENQIEFLKKAKQKLITEVVTGKIDVTNL